MESGAFELEDGTRVEVGRISVDHGFASVAFNQSFASTPVVLSQAQTYDDPAAVVTRQRGASASGFEVRLQEEEANDPVHDLETVGYVAIEAGVGMTGGVMFEAATTPDAVTHGWYPLGFLQSYGDPVFVAGLQTIDGGDTAGLRYRNLDSTSAEVFVEEETSRDSEVAHTTEVVGYLVFDHPGALSEPGGGQTPPPAPTGLSPDDGQEFPNGTSVTMSASPVSGATGYEFEIQHDSGGGAWATYWTYTSDTSSFTFWPQYPDRAYRFRARAENEHGWGPYSTWATFTVGTLAGPPPAPTGLSPDGGQAYPGGGAVVMSCTAIQSATGYEFAIEYLSGGVWKTYYAYTTSGSAKTFYPAVHGTDYRFRVRAENEHGWGAHSPWASFHVND
jgi:hypothetical protein